MLLTSDFSILDPQARRFYYRKGDLMQCEEDSKHEFKCHTAMAVEDLPPWTQESGARTKRAISRSINAFLNSEKGGTVYLGVADTGIIIGLELTLFQKDHLRVNLDNLMKRYKPSVPLERYSVCFVPVVDSNETEDNAIEICMSVKRDEESSNKMERQRNHLCQTYEQCWCLTECKFLYHSKQLVQTYVMEIEIRPWDPQQMQWDNVNIQPLHSNEEGIVFIRTLASVVQCDDQEIVNRTRRKVAEFYKSRINAIKEQIKQLES